MSRESLQTLAESLVFIDTDDGIGSGVFIGKRESDGRVLVLTCAHVIGKAKRIVVRQRRDGKNGFSYPSSKAIVEGSNQELDLALLSIKPRNDVKILGLADEEPDLFEEVYVGGHPNAEEWICAPGTYEGVQKTNPMVCLFYGPVFGGSSGGALVDVYGRLVGIVASQSNDGPVRIQNLGYAVTFSAIEKFLKSSGGQEGK